MKYYLWPHINFILILKMKTSSLLKTGLPQFFILGALGFNEKFRNQVFLNNQNIKNECSSPDAESDA
jgi:hypothetical protein